MIINRILLLLYVIIPLIGSYYLTGFICAIALSKGLFVSVDAYLGIFSFIAIISYALGFPILGYILGNSNKKKF